MDLIAVRSFVDEFEKIAVSLKALRAAAKRLNPEKADLGGLGAVVSPTLSQRASPVAKRLGLFQRRAFPEMNNNPAIKAFSRRAKENPGKIYTDGKVGELMAPAASRLTKDRVGDYAIVHEALERGSKLRMGSLHGSPAVLAKDFNLRNTISGHGSKKFRKVIDPLRKPEDAHLRTQLVSAFKDPRAADFMAPGTKIPKAMRRQMDKKEFKLSTRKAREIAAEQGKHLMGQAIKAQTTHAKKITGVFE